MIHFFIGTKAQLIKMAPLMIELVNRGIRFRYVDSGQHGEISRSLRRVFAVPDPDVSLRGQGGDIVTTLQAANWYIKSVSAVALRRRWLREEVFPGGGICLIHGDTLSTLLGMQLARAAGLEVAHVEAGLRSFKFWDPFPEELIRIRCMRQAQILFAPSREASANLESMHVKGEVIRVPGNTVADALRIIDAPVTERSIEEPFALATCHRLETIANRRRLAQVVELFNHVADSMPVVFVRHKPTAKYLEKFGLERKLGSNVRRIDMLDYGDFIALLKRAHVVLTDGGSIQEECAYLSKPCLILRNATERSDGLDTNATLWRFDDSRARAFLSDLPDRASLESLPRPSAAIVDALVERGYAAP